MRAHGDLVAVIHDDDPIGLQHRGQPMRDDDGGASLHEPLERLLHEQLRLRIERARGLIQQEDRRILEDRARQRDALALTARQPRAALAEERVVALRELAQESVCGRRDGGGFDLPHRSHSGRP